MLLRKVVRGDLIPISDLNRIVASGDDVLQAYVMVLDQVIVARASLDILAPVVQHYQKTRMAGYEKNIEHEDSRFYDSFVIYRGVIC